MAADHGGPARRRCHRLAQLAQAILKGKDDLHRTVGETASTLTKLLGRSRIERVFAAELAEQIPLPVDRPLVTVARSIRITGVMRCVAAGLDLDYCECLRDLITAEGHEQTKRLLLTAADNYWTTHYKPPANNTPATPPNPPS